MRRCVTSVSSFALALGLAATASAQAPAYALPDAASPSRALPSQGTLDDRVADAPWRLGALRLAPWLGLRDASTVTGTNIGGGTENDDFTVTAGAGLRAYLRNGPKVVWAAHLLPEYTWWADDPGRRRLNGRYGAGVFGYFSRLELGISHRLLEQQDFFSSEVQRLTPTRTEHSRAVVNLRLGGRIWLTGSGERRKFANLEDGNEVLSGLDRTEERIRAGVEYRGPRGWQLRAALENVANDFASGARRLSNESTAVVVGSGFSGNRFALDLEIETREIEPDPGSLVPKRDETLGAVRTIWALSERSSLLVYAQRGLGYALSPGASYIVSQRLGVTWQGNLGRAVTLSLFGETGEDDFRNVTGGTLPRTDDLVSFGTQIHVRLAQKARLRLDARRDDVSSNLPGVDRDITVIGIGLDILPFQRALDRAFDRLRLGDPSQDW